MRGGVCTCCVNVYERERAYARACVCVCVGGGGGGGGRAEREKAYECEWVSCSLCLATLPLTVYETCSNRCPS